MIVPQLRCWFGVVRKHSLPLVGLGKVLWGEHRCVFVWKKDGGQQCQLRFRCAEAMIGCHAGRHGTEGSACGRFFASAACPGS